MEASALSAPVGLGRGSVTSAWLRLRSDEQLVGLFRSGNEDAFRVIHDRYRPRLLAYARQMVGSTPDAEDVLQDVFLRAYRALRVDERPISLRAWLYRVAHNRCIDGLRRPVPVAAEVYEVSRGPSIDTGDEVERRADLRRLIEDLGRLPGQQRSALLMREMDGMSYADLAQALDTTVPAVKSLLVRARIGLVEAVEARDADCSDIRHDLAASYDRGVRASSRARRHLRDCPNCTTYRTQLRAVRQEFAALSPSPTAGIVAKLLSLTGAGGGAGGAAAAGSSTTAALGGGAAAAASATKVAALVCCAAALTGGAVEVATPGAHLRVRTPARSVVVHAPSIHAPASASAERFPSAHPAPVAGAPHRTPATPRSLAKVPTPRGLHAEDAVPEVDTPGGAVAVASPAPPVPTPAAGGSGDDTADPGGTTSSGSSISPLPSPASPGWGDPSGGGDDPADSSSTSSTSSGWGTPSGSSPDASSASSGGSGSTSSSTSGGTGGSGTTSGSGSGSQSSPRPG